MSHEVSKLSHKVSNQSHQVEKVQCLTVIHKSKKYGMSTSARPSVRDNAVYIGWSVDSQPKNANEHFQSSLLAKQ